MSIPAARTQILDFSGSLAVTEPSPGQLPSDPGLLLVRQFDQRIGLTRSFADALDDPRGPRLTEHTFVEMVRSRVCGILAGYQVQASTLGHIVIDRGGQVAEDARAIRVLRQRVPVVAFVNNHFASYAPETARQLAELTDAATGQRGPS